MIMAAGLGTRMRPLTDTRPKPLVSLAGRTLLDHGLARLDAAGVEKVVINVHYLADRIEAHLAGRTRPQVFISDERDHLLDTGGGITKALPELGDEAFFVLNCDSLWHEAEAPLLDQLRAAWDGSRMDCLLALAPTRGSLGYGGAGDFECAADGALARRSSATAPFVNTGAYIIHPQVFQNVPDGPFSMNLIWDALIAEGRLHGHPMDGLWMHVGTPEALAEAEARLLQLGT
jgi:MurNAc alpha-1-phosphate uridylyltransferase